MTLTIPATLYLPLAVTRQGLAGLIMALALLTSCFVASEPAPTDAFMMIAIIALPILGMARGGPIATVQFAVWLAICALGILATIVSPIASDTFKHTLITLFLAGGAFILAAYIRFAPQKRFALIGWCYALSAAIATLLALIGYFDVIPGTYDAFTLYGRAKGTFKDPNVYAAALPLAIAFLSWRVLRGETSKPVLSSVLAVLMLVGLLISFSRGAWMAGATTLLIIGAIAAITATRRTDQNRLLAVLIAGSFATVVALGAALQSDKVQQLLSERMTLTQSYDEGPNGRFGGQAKAVDLILENPFGIGANVFSQVHHHEEPHQVYLSMFLNGGWVGGLLYIIAVLSTIAIGTWGVLYRPDLRGPFLIATAAFAGSAIQGLVVETDHWRHFFIAMGLIWGLADAVRPHANAART